MDQVDVVASIIQGMKERFCLAEKKRASISSAFDLTFRSLFMQDLPDYTIMLMKEDVTNYKAAKNSELSKFIV